MAPAAARMKRIVIVAAPFGYGPASKALQIADHLSAMAEITIISKGDAFQFLKKFSHPTVTCLQGTFDEVFRQVRADSDCYISIGNVPAVEVLIAAGLQNKLVFVDSLFPWRMQFDPPRWLHSIQACLVEDFPGVSVKLSGIHAHRVEVVAPLIRKPDCIPGLSARNSTITLALGGVTSPLVRWTTVKDTVSKLVSGVITQAGENNKKIQIAGSANLQTLVAELDKDICVMGDVSPAEMIKLISQSELVISTPGLGTIYESIACNVPVLLLPPMNSTGLFQSETYLKHGFSSTLGPASIRMALSFLTIPAWHQQTLRYIDWFNANQDHLLEELPSLLSAVFHADRGMYNHLLEVQDNFAKLTSNKDPLAVIDEIVTNI